MKLTRWLRQRWTLVLVIFAALYVTEEMVGYVMQGVLANWVLFAVAGGWIALWLTMRLGWWLHYQDEMGERLERQYKED